MKKPWPWSLAGGGVTLIVRLTPKGGRDAIDGIHLLDDGRAVVKGQARAAPREGGTNAALRKLIARAVDVPPRDMTLVAGATSRSSE